MRLRFQDACTVLMLPTATLTPFTRAVTIGGQAVPYLASDAATPPSADDIKAQAAARFALAESLLGVLMKHKKAQPDGLIVDQTPDRLVRIQLTEGAFLEAFFWDVRCDPRTGLFSCVIEPVSFEGPDVAILDSSDTAGFKYWAAQFGDKILDWPIKEVAASPEEHLSVDWSAHEIIELDPAEENQNAA